MASDKQRSAFFSYSRINKDFATKLAKGLRSAGYPLWFDLFDIPPGARWDDEVEKALHECSIFMIILTPASIASENVKDEIGFAIDHGKRILPILLEPCEVPLRLRRFQYVDFTAKSFEEGFESAKELLGDLVEQSSSFVAGGNSNIETPSESKPITSNPKGTPVYLEKEKLRLSSTRAGQKNLISKGLIIGVIAVIALAILGICYSLAKKSAIPIITDTQVSNAIFTATSTSIATNLVTETPLVTSEGPVALDAIDAIRLYDSNTAVRLLGIARQQIGTIENYQKIPITLNESMPVWIGYNWCATNKDILSNNLKFVKSSASINGQPVPENKFAVAYQTNMASAGDPLIECALIFIVLDNWTPGEHLINVDISLTETVFNGVANEEPSSNIFGYLITIP
jgi:hypothetical protein